MSTEVTLKVASNDNIGYVDTADVAKIIVNNCASYLYRTSNLIGLAQFANAVPLNNSTSAESSIT
jgi:hypothetical protein